MIGKPRKQLKAKQSGRPRKASARSKKTQTKNSRIKLFIFLVLLILVPVLYGGYLYYQQTNLVNTTSSYSNKQVGKQQSKELSDQQDKQLGKQLSKLQGKQAQLLRHYDGLEIPTGLTNREEQLIEHTGYTVSYNPQWRIPNWVAYELTREETKGTEGRSSKFVPDPMVKGPTALHSDYTRSGYDRGHMAPAADMKWSSQVMKESFYLSNVCPQHPQLNQRSWKVLEDKIRQWAIADSAIVIVCGPIIHTKPQTIGRNQVAVPQQFFKVILSLYGSSPKAIGFLFNNERAVETLSKYVVTVDSIEALTGMDFFSPLPDELEEELESTVELKKWNLN